MRDVRLAERYTFMSATAKRPMYHLALNAGALSNELDDYLVWAARIGSPKLVAYLLTQGADPNYDGRVALEAANLSGNEATIALLR